MQQEPGRVAVTATPASVGLNPRQLAVAGAYVRQQVDEGKAPMMRLVVARYGEVCYSCGAGTHDVAGKLPFADDTILRLYSMSKVIVSVAAMILVERAQLHLDFAVARYLPCFADMQASACVAPPPHVGSMPLGRDATPWFGRTAARSRTASRPLPCLCGVRRAREGPRDRESPSALEKTHARRSTLTSTTAATW